MGLKKKKLCYFFQYHFFFFWISCIFVYYSNSKIMVFFFWNSFSSYSCAPYRLTTSISKNWSIAFIVTTFLLSHISVHIIHLFSTLFSLSKLLFSLFKKKKTILLPISPHLLLHFLQSFPSLLPFCFPTTLYFTSLSSHYSHFIVTLSSSYFILYKFNIISPIQFIFPPQKILSSLSLSLSHSHFL